MEVFGVVAPHPPIMVEAVGGERSHVTDASARAMRLAGDLLHEFDPDVLVICSPHAPIARAVFLVRTDKRLAGDLAQFGAPSARWRAEGDPEFANALITEATRAKLPTAPLAQVAPGEREIDHGVLVPISFLDPRGDFPAVIVSPSFMPLEAHYAFGEAVRRTAERLGRRVAFIASGDLSHRLTPDAPAGYDPAGVELDAQIVRAIDQGDLVSLMDIDPGLVSAGGECGLRSFVMLAGFAGPEAAVKRLHYEGPWGVGYLTALVGDPPSLIRSGDGSEASADHEDARTPGGDADAGSLGGTAGADESPHVRLARQAIEAYVKEGRVIEPFDDPAFSRRAGAFVSLHKGDDLRGCIGTIAPREEDLGHEIVAMAIEAATHDPRFPPVTPDELDALDISVDVLSPPETVDDPSDLDPKEFGVIVTSGWRRGLLLPDLDGVETVEQQISIARRKAGIGPDEPVRLERFRVERFH
ncbi:MAG: AmmeMemoRadiSam system protein A [Coriobacteriia bacterium]